jgi:2-polyprenyl-3-methyl-5-hydroxy-6-metoxy-1,4-benzoquinol methylase
MSTSGLNTLFAAIRRGRNALWRARAKHVPGRFQPYNHTLPNRYPWIFQFLSASLVDSPGLRLLSFGCSRGVEVFSLRDYFRSAALKGIDIDPANIAACLERARSETTHSSGMTFEVAATVRAEEPESYDAILCLAVLCHGDLSTPGTQRCDHLLRFNDFETLVGDFARCLKPGGLLILHTTNFRFCDTRFAADFETVLEAQPDQLAADVKFDPDNRLMRGVRYCEVGFRKRLRPPHPVPL